MDKKNKKKSIVRYEAIIPLCLLLTFLSLYLIFFLDKNLKFALEWALTRAHGAEVNIGSVDTRLKDLNVDIQDVQFTYDKNPKLNVVQFKQLQLNLIWKALLQSKYVIPQANLKQIQTMTPRKREGRVLAQSQKTGYRGAKNNIKEQFNKKVEKNILNDIYKISTGTEFKDQVKNIQLDLKSDQKIKQLEKDLKNKEKEWKQKVAELPTKEDFKSYEKRIKSLDLKSKNIKDIALTVKEASKLYSEVKKEIATFKTNSSQLKKDMSSFKTEVSQFDNLVKEDMSNLKKKFNIPSFDANSISKSVFFPIIESKLQEFKRYIITAQSYFPKSKKDDGEIAPPERGKGRNYYFPKKNSYPKFWLKKADISSTANDSELSGNFVGQITNISNNPKHLGVPIIAKIKGDAPKQQIKDIDALITVDHTGDTPIEKAEFTVGSFPAKDLMLSESDDLTLAIAKSLLNSKVTAFHSNNNFKLNLANTFNQATYLVEGKSKSMQKMIQSTLKRMAALTLNGSVEGTWTDFDLKIKSNFGKELSNALTGKIKDKVSSLESDLKTKYFSKINSQKAGLMKNYNKLSASNLKEISSKEEYLEKLKKEIARIKNKKPSLKNIDQEKLKKKGKKMLKDLFG